MRAIENIAADILKPEQIQQLRQHWLQNDPERLSDKCQKLQIKICTIHCREYPQYLHAIHRPPLVMFYRGKLSDNGNQSLAMVGMRRSSFVGKKIARDLSCILADRGITIVSGAARGIDTAAHEGALATERGTTIAVLGCGIDYIYPPENKQLLECISERGAVISEYLPGTRPNLGNFPQRNRIISGLCRGVLVVEAAAKSGSLITADFALEQGRDVYAIPGSMLSENHKGCHWLIKQGAKLVDNAEDIIEDYFHLSNSKQIMQKRALDLTVDEKIVYDCLQVDYALSIDELVELTEWTAARLSATLMGLVIKDAVIEHNGRRYSKCS